MNEQTKLNFEAAQIHGSDYVPERDRARLTGQLEKLYNLMKDGQWRKLQDISDLTGIPQASASAQMRNLRKEPFCFTIEKKHIADGLFYYRLLLPDAPR